MSDVSLLAYVVAGLTALELIRSLFFMGYVATGMDHLKRVVETMGRIASSLENDNQRPKEPEPISRRPYIAVSNKFPEREA